MQAAEISDVLGELLHEVEWDEDPDSGAPFQDVAESPFPAKHPLTRKEPFTMWEIISGPDIPPSKSTLFTVSTKYYRVQNAIRRWLRLVEADLEDVVDEGGSPVTQTLVWNAIVLAARKFADDPFSLFHYGHGTGTKMATIVQIFKSSAAEGRAQPLSS